jgi:two-component system response regulator LytT
MIIETLPVVIVEDEPVIARDLAHLLKTIDDRIVVVAIIASVEAAVTWFNNNLGLFHLIFMDIRLGDGSSFDILKQVKLECPVIFVTSYQEYALQAFKSNGIDYILKPFNEQELSNAVAKYNNWIKVPDSKKDNSFELLLSQINQLKQHYKKSFLVHFRNKLIPLETNRISWFYTNNEMVHAQTDDNRQYVIDENMEALTGQLEPQQFFRANRQFILNRKSIVEVDFFFNGRLSLKVNPAPPEQILVSKARVPEFKTWMNL